MKEDDNGHTVHCQGRNPLLQVAMLETPWMKLPKRLNARLAYVRQPEGMGEGPRGLGILKG